MTSQKRLNTIINVLSRFTILFSTSLLIQRYKIYMYSFLKGRLVLSFNKPISNKDYIYFIFLCHIGCSHKYSFSHIFENFLAQIVSLKKITISKFVRFSFSLVFLRFRLIQCAFKNVFIPMV